MQMDKKEGQSVEALIEEVKEYVRRQEVIIENLKSDLAARDEEISRQWGIGYSEGFQAGRDYRETFWEFIQKKFKRDK